ncbi:hypothetical protein NDU88_002166 [Pleurodeles waltl]|uniref:Uncharacterized protein n=1 Tax=Pleurodeles waltl TaxID=8319 RepID=A0AAV7P5X7_PLEWA|nr:hypothetical protein NDU88_002166 [Pleurodeles waltl]
MEKDRGNPRSRGVVVWCSRAREERRTDGAARTQNGGCSDRIIAAGEAAATGGDRPEGGKNQIRRIGLTMLGRLGRRERRSSDSDAPRPTDRYGEDRKQ